MIAKWNFFISDAPPRKAMSLHETEDFFLRKRLAIMHEPSMSPLMELSRQKLLYELSLVC